MTLAEVFVKIGLDDKDFNSKIGGISGKLGKLGGAIKTGIGTATKVVGAAAAAGTAAVGGLVKSAVSAYGEYEQLMGGIETLFGESADEMMKNAKNAFKTAGMSANEYMNTAIESSAAMIKAVEGDTKRAAELTNQAIIDMSDNVNKMGTTMEAVQNAYRGFSRGNFTMLDNLSLGYSGTKEGMKELLEDAKAISGIDYDIESYADMVEAIHVIQNEMGITGTTSKEAAGTVTGSFASMSAAYKNLITGLGDKNADLGQLFDDLLDTAFGDGTKDNKGVIGNMLPVFGTALTSIGKLVETRLPSLLERLPGFLEEYLPMFIGVVGKLLGSIGSFIKDRLPFLMSSIRGWIKDNWPKIRDAVEDILNDVIDWLSENLPKMAGDLGEAIGTFLGDAAEYVIPKLPEILGTLLNSALEFFTGIFDSLDEKIPGLGFLLEGLTTVVLIGVGAWKAYQAAMAISGLFNTLKSALTATTGAQTGLNVAMSLNPAIAIAAAIVALIGVLVILWNNCEAFRDFWIGVWKAIQNAMDVAVEAIAGWIGDVGKWFSDLWNDIKDAWEGLKQLASDVCGAIGDFFNGIWDAMADAIGTVVDKIKGLIGWIEKAIDGFNGLMDSAMETVFGEVKAGEFVDMTKDPEWQKKFQQTKANYNAKHAPTNPNARYKKPYAKAMDNAYLLNGATIFGEMGGSLLEGGERGQEMIVGTDYLAGMIADAMANTSQPEKIIIPVYIGNERITEVVVNAQNTHNYITGGR